VSPQPLGAPLRCDPSHPIRPLNHAYQGRRLRLGGKRIVSKEIRMCLGVPGKVIQWLNRDPVFGLALVEFGGVRRECHMACVPDAELGDYVIVHAGIAIGRINEQEAERTLQDFAAIAESLADHDSPSDEELA